MIDPSALRILIVDDNEFARSNARTMLGRLGIRQVEEASGGAEALGLLQSQKFDILLTDWYMPDVSGAGLLSILRDDRVKSVNQHIPTIVMTAYANSENSEKAQKLGAREFLIKPLDRRTLSASILKLISPVDPEGGSDVTDDESDPNAASANVFPL